MHKILVFGSSGILGNQIYQMFNLDILAANFPPAEIQIAV